MEISYPDLVSRFMEEYPELCEGFNEEEMKEVLNEPFRFVKDRMSECYAGPIRFLHLGQWRVIERWRQKLEDEGGLANRKV